MLMEKERQALHAKIEADYNERLKELQEARERAEQERQEGHNWVAGVPAGLLSLFLNGTSVVTSEAPILTEPPHVAPRPKQARSRSGINLRPSIRAFIRELPVGADVTTPIVYEALCERYDWAREHSDPPQLRAQIATAFPALMDEGLIELVEKGSSQTPHLYRKIEEVAVKAIARDSFLNEDRQEALI